MLRLYALALYTSGKEQNFQSKKGFNHKSYGMTGSGHNPFD